MEIELKPIKVRDLVKGFADNDESGVRGYDGKLDIRPPYQREFIYEESKRMAVIDTIRNGYPLNVMYWAKRDNDAEVPYEVLDGQQRTISICQYVQGYFAIQDGQNLFTFDNLTQEEKDEILDYELMIYVCSGSDIEKLKWFETINISGEELTQQELRNAVYAGPFVSDAKRYFSKSNCPAYQLGKDLIVGTPIRQEYLETALKWKAFSESTPSFKQSIVGYMSQHQHDPNASQLWQYFCSVITWVTSTFDVSKHRKIMKGLEWGVLYERFHNKVIDKQAISQEISKLIIDSEVQTKRGICPYVLTRDEHFLGLRSFPIDMKMEVWEKQKHHCANPNCPNHDKEFELEEMEGDHITPWSQGGKTVIENCQMLCRDCNRRKGSK